MKIVYLHQYFTTPDMPGGTRSYEMARCLVARGHEVHMVTADTEGGIDGSTWRESVEDGIRVHWTRVPYSNRMPYRERIQAFFRFAVRAAQRAASLPADVVFATSTPLTIALPAVYASKRKRVPMVFEVRDLWPAVPIAMGVIRNPALKIAATALEKFAYRNAAEVVALAPGMKDAIVETGYPADRVTVIPNAADLALFDVPPERGRELRARYTWLGNRPLVVFIGTLGVANGTGYLVDVAALVQRLDPEIRFALIGGGKEEELVREAATRHGVLDRSLFLVGKVKKREVPAWLSAADMATALFTGPRVVWKDAVQNKFFDALAAGRPIANNFDGWQSRIAVEEGCGLILPPDDPGAAAAQLVEKLRDRAWLERAGQIARRLAQTRFDRQKLALDLESVLERAIAACNGHVDRVSAG